MTEANTTILKHTVTPLVLLVTLLLVGAAAQVCPQGKWGANCTQDCFSTTCFNNTCDINTGECTMCQNYTIWGPNCSSQCSPLCGKGVCNITGLCFSCQGASWGPTCTYNCSSVCVPDHWTCQADNGYCNTCPSNSTYGPYCNYTCSARCQSGLCIAGYGWCMLGCAASNTWGKSCEYRCPNGCNSTSSSCDQSTGACTVCNPGHWGPLCLGVCPTGCSISGACSSKKVCTVCDAGFFGAPTCNLTCGHCSGGACSNNGTCLSGCTDFFTGPTCTNPPIYDNADWVWVWIFIVIVIIFAGVVAVRLRGRHFRHARTPSYAQMPPIDVNDYLDIQAKKNAAANSSSSSSVLGAINGSKAAAALSSYTPPGFQVAGAPLRPVRETSSSSTSSDRV